MRTRLIAKAMLSFLIPVHCLAQVPEVMNYQGKLLNGTNLVNATTTMVFRLFNATTSGSQVYVETQSVTVVDGLYAVSIGGDPDAGTLRAAITNQPLYLEVQVGATVLSPRERIAASTYALMAAGVTNGTINVAMLDTNSVDARYASKGSVMPWVDVTSTSQQAQANIGYVARNAAQVVVTLPASPALGDIVRVSGAGAGGWRLAQNAGQCVLCMNLNYGAMEPSWGPLTNSGSHSWRNMDMSDDGTKLCAAVYDGFIYTSSDGGSTWTNRAASRSWQGLASSGDGSVILAGDFTGYLHMSYDGGITWIARTAVGTGEWWGFASSADGTKLIGGPDYNQHLFRSEDSGATWAACTSAGAGDWYCVASSSDGNALLAGNSTTGLLYRTVNGGASWTAVSGIATGNWLGAASSANGSITMAGRNNDYILH